MRTILAAGYSPLSFFARDISKYFYLAELLALVDLSLVSRRAPAGGAAEGRRSAPPAPPPWARSCCEAAGVSTLDARTCAKLPPCLCTCL